MLLNHNKNILVADHPVHRGSTCWFHYLYFQQYQENFRYLYQNWKSSISICLYRQNVMHFKAAWDLGLGLTCNLSQAADQEGLVVIHCKWDAVTQSVLKAVFDLMLLIRIRHAQQVLFQKLWTTQHRAVVCEGCHEPVGEQSVFTMVISAERFSNVPPASWISLFYLGQRPVVTKLLYQC